VSASSTQLTHSACMARAWSFARSRSCSPDMHIHFTDVASFPVHSDAFPQLAAKGRISRLVWQSEQTEAVYSRAELRSLVAYAHERGVRVIPEFDGKWNLSRRAVACYSRCMGFESLSCELAIAVAAAPIRSAWARRLELRNAGALPDELPLRAGRDERARLRGAHGVLE
jgi:hypothetical protein